MRGKYKEEVVKVSEIYLDEENPRFPPVNSQREAMRVMLKEQGEKIANLASDIYENGINPSSKLIIIESNKGYIDADGNRRLTALKILENPSLSSSEPRVKRKIESILEKEGGLVPKEVGCVIFENIDDARHWVSVNHSGPQAGVGQISWGAEQKNRFDGKYTIGLQAIDLLVKRELMSGADKRKINKTTIDRLLGYKEVRLKLDITKSGEHFEFGDIPKLKKVSLSLKGVTVDQVYTAKKGLSFVENVLMSGADCPSIQDAGGRTESNEENETGLGVEGADVGAEANEYMGEDSNIESVTGSPARLETDDRNLYRSRRKRRPGPEVFGGPLYLRAGHVNNIYRDVELLYKAFKSGRMNFSEDFVVIFRMSLRMLAETAAREIGKDLKFFLIENFDSAKKELGQDIKTEVDPKFWTGA